jgi:D-alanine--poly(phosphoribitol) ligase subunit 2
MTEDVRTKVRNHLQEAYFKNGSVELTDETPLLSSGIIDSISALQLVEFLEREFGFEFEAHEVDQDNLNTLDTIVNFVKGKVA